VKRAVKDRTADFSLKTRLFTLLKDFATFRKVECDQHVNNHGRSERTSSFPGQKRTQQLATTRERLAVSYWVSFPIASASRFDELANATEEFN
jgi:hypothetical protein